MEGYMKKDKVHEYTEYCIYYDRIFSTTAC